MISVIEQENRILIHVFDCVSSYPFLPEFGHNLNKNRVAMRQLIVGSVSKRFLSVPEKNETN